MFNSAIGTEKSVWCQSVLQLYQIAPSELEQLLETGFAGKSDRPKELKQTGRKPLSEGRLFAVTGKQLQFDFADVVTLGWLQKADGQFQVVESLPEVVRQPSPLASIAFSEVLSNIIETDAIDLFEHLGQPIRGVQRLFLDIEYIVPGKLSEQVINLQQGLKQVWEHDPVAPIRITYRSARLYGDVGDYVVYPVCVRYFQRAPYLFAYGYNPQSLTQDNWYDFRLDRIEQLEVLEWAESHLSLRDRCLNQPPPCPQSVRQSPTEVWGFDIYSSTETLLKAIKSGAATQMIQSAVLHPVQQKSLLSVVREKPKDIYCRVD
ncbi:MAG: TIGR03985 family CRISPR-associated protein [Phormidesmis sp. CAN_BIN44]|nr:TIGR03985 family CRISPR-associated protein [Phormidesmis sp. CAN_BIN44]